MNDIVAWVQGHLILIALVVGCLIALFVALKVSKLIMRLTLLVVFLALAAGALWYYFGRR